MSTDETPEPHRFRKKPIQVSLYFSKEDVGVAADFEGETSSISRQGMGARVDSVSVRARDAERSLEDMEGKTLFAQFHVPWGKSIRPQATVEMVGPSEDPRFRIYLGMSFENEINLTRLVSGP